MPVVTWFADGRRTQFPAPTSAGISRVTLNGTPVGYTVIPNLGVALLVPPAAGQVVSIDYGESLEFLGLAGAAGVLTLTSVPAKEYVLALRGSQAGFGNLIDQDVDSANDAQTQTALFPPAWSANTAVALGNYRSPTTLNGNLYRCTTAGTTGATEPATWNPTIGGTTTDGTAVWTTERGPWHLSAGGWRHFRSIVNTQVGAPGSFTFPAIDFNLANGDSLILNVQQQFNYTSGGATNLNETQVMGNRLASASPGISLVATGQTTFNDLRLRVSDGTTSRTAAHVASGFARKPGDGTLRTTTYFIDGQTKRMYCFADAIPMVPADFTGVSANDIVAWDADISAVTGSTASTNKFIIGALPVAGGETSPTTFEFSIRAFDLLVFKNRGLPSSLQNVATWFHQRGEALLPQGLLL